MPARQYIERLFGLAGRTCVITGGAGTLCGAIAEGFLKAGALVALWGHHMETLSVQKEHLVSLGASPDHIACFRADLTKEEDGKKALGATADTFGKPDILVNGVGGSSIRKPLVEADAAEFERTLVLNLTGGCFLPSKLFAAYWIENRIMGRILNIASMGSYNPLSGAWAYSAAKAGVVNQTMGYARELAPYGIRVNAIAPGFFLGKQNRHLLRKEDGTPTERGRNVLAHTPANRFGEPCELAGSAIFLCSNASGFVTGVTLPVDGGYLCHNI
ncbi:MAG: putative oxidoreductase UxuB [Lentisphaerae bacterium ADurb.Bin242]|nr:MAG: putative oxidoreductase UxuB [Lentisphaerae bacterium ADurb.Bin242]